MNKVLYETLLRETPEILRARGWRLYAKDGRRLVDLWQYGGRAILGHNPPGLLRAFKNAGERGLFAPFPHFAEGRLLKALAALFPRRAFRLYPGEASLYAALAAAGFGLQENACVSLDLASQKTVPRWRPYLDEAEMSVPVFVPVLPFPFPGAPAALVLDPALDADFPPSPVLSAAALAAAARCVWDLAAAPDRGRPKFPRLDRALKQNACWKRRGIYLFRESAGTDHAAVFRRFLKGGFLLPPQPEESAILPGELSPGEEAKLAGLLTETAGSRV